jgi:putative transposase
MRSPACEKLEIIQLVERSHLPVRRTLEKLGIPRATLPLVRSLSHPLSPRELAVRFTETENYFVSEASVYRLLKAHDLIASPAFIGGPEALGDRSPRPDRVWNRIPDMVREQIIKLALDEPAS